MNNAFNSSKSKRMVYGLDTLVTLKDGRRVPVVNLDNAATTPPFKEVVRKIQESLQFYGSIGRGTGQKSELSTNEYVKVRKTVLDFLGVDPSGEAQPKYTVFYTNCTTDGMNKLASALVRGSEDIVLTTRMEHHANDLPWRERGRTVYAEVDEKGRLIVEDFERILKMYDGKIKYVAVTAASNVTGYVNDVHKIAGIAHKYGAKIIVDGAQIVAHRRFSMLGDTRNEDIDFFVFSAHKMYSPFGGGAVVGLVDELNRHIPGMYGGGMIETVTDDGVFYTDAPDLYEAGSPNFPGVVGMAKAMEVLEEIGFEYIEQHEQALMNKAISELSRIPEVVLYGDNKNYKDRVGIITFTIEGMENQTVTEALAAYSAIAVRQAAFCAHPYVRRLTKAPVRYDEDGHLLYPAGLIRVSFGIYNTKEDVHTLVKTIKRMINEPTEILVSSMPLIAAHTHDTRLEYLYKRPHDRG